jgi:hypothetical protein
MQSKHADTRKIKIRANNHPLILILNFSWSFREHSARRRRAAPSLLRHGWRLHCCCLRSVLPLLTASHGSMGISPCSPHRTAAQHLASFAPCAATSCQQHRAANDLDLTPPASTSHGVHRDRRRNRTVAVAISHGVGRAAATAQDL